MGGGIDNPPQPPFVSHLPHHASFHTLRLESASCADWAAKATSTSDSGPGRCIPDEIIAMLPGPVRRLLPSPLVVIRNLWLVEACAGVARIVNWATRAGLPAVAYDVKYGQHMNCLTDDGFALLFVAICRVRAGGLFFIAPQCSSWVWLSRSSTGRSSQNPDGRTNVRCVVDGNRLNLVTSLLCMIATALGVLWIVEQPSSSLFFLTQHMRFAVEHCAATKLHTWLGGFGHPMSKPTLLVGTPPWLSGLHCPKPGGGGKGKCAGQSMQCKGKSKDNHKGKSKAKAGHIIPKTKAKANSGAQARLGYVVHGEGLRKVTGDKGCIQASQVYPARFALQVVHLLKPDAFGM